ncbi:MAG: hypothetical protein JXR36_03940 [Bacteroidales bacterium]|nr:hypothetical protein [Bacteroidales bacterium]
MITSKTGLWIVFCIVLLSFLTFSCDPETPITPNDTTAGQTEGFWVTTLDTTIGLYLAYFNDGVEFYELDLDKDGIKDLKFHGFQDYWHGPTSYNTSIYCLHDSILLSHYSYTDTIFLSIGSNYHEEGDTTVCTTYYRYNCERQNTDDSINSFMDGSHIKALQFGDKLNEADFWSSSTSHMRKYNYPYGAALPAYLYSSNDTAYYEGTSTNYSCHNFAQNEIIYVGFKIIYADFYKLGWIKLELIDNYKIHLIEYGLMD